jgi:hypothetical protein
LQFAVIAASSHRVNRTRHDAAGAIDSASQYQTLDDDPQLTLSLILGWPMHLHAVTVRLKAVT